MQKLLSAIAALLLVAGMAGCQTQERQELSEVPPPAFDEAEEFEPVVVEDEDEPELVEVEEEQGSTLTDDEQPQAERDSAGQGTTYTVRRGDTLWSIAQRHYGDGTRMRDIIEANPDINNPDEISAGQEIILP